MATISLGLIKRAPRMGARLGVTVEGCRLWVSTVFYAGQRYTRVDDAGGEGDPCFFEGEIDSREAGSRYIDGCPDGVAA